MALYIKKEDGYKGVYTRKDIPEGSIVADLIDGKLIQEPTRTSIQVGRGFHIEDEIGSCINHSCQPSCKIRSFLVIALRDIGEGEEVTFDYNESEEEVISPFECKCCGKMILGRKHEQKTTESRDERG